ISARKRFVSSSDYVCVSCRRHRNLPLAPFRRIDCSAWLGGRAGQRRSVCQRWDTGRQLAVVGGLLVCVGELDRAAFGPVPTEKLEAHWQALCCENSPHRRPGPQARVCPPSRREFAAPAAAPTTAPVKPAAASPESRRPRAGL